MMQLPPVDPACREQIRVAARELAGDDEIVCVCHIGPDGDALGSILALGLAFRAMGRPVAIGWGSDEIVVPPQYAFLPGAELLRPPAAMPDTRCAIAVDCASADRLGVLRERLERTEVFVNLDHHVSNTRFAGIDVIDPEAPSSSELVLRLLLEMGAPLDLDVATCLYTGLVTDTGQFRYANVTPRAHLVAAALVDLGVRPDVVSQAIYESLPFGYLKLVGRVLERSRLEDGMILSHIAAADLDDFGLTLDDTEGVIDDLRAIREADVAALFKEIDGSWKLSLRSKGGTDVGAVAQRLGGGGHTLAAGVTLGADLDDAVALLRRTLGEGGWSTNG